MRVACLVLVWAPGGSKVREIWCVGPPESLLGCPVPSLGECEVPQIGVFGGFVVVKLSWEFWVISFHQVRS